jgi:hypothetical protein
MKPGVLIPRFFLGFFLRHCAVSLGQAMRVGEFEGSRRGVAVGVEVE